MLTILLDKGRETAVFPLVIDPQVRDKFVLLNLQKSSWCFVLVEKPAMKARQFRLAVPFSGKNAFQHDQFQSCSPNFIIYFTSDESLFKILTESKCTVCRCNDGHSRRTNVLTTDPEKRLITQLTPTPIGIY
ncbi:hypothetical protein T4B_5218 [Trichinella pseudospiralis]|uniref:Uncharacterized protein n=2 Tax=Trichinella pseudospiralis TaxID=6337 RepID=A0A0V1KBL9_TRIPS|nr:hypothetical protein T4A_5148 [Trichinella pseudospiralis]KRY91048.1 hypothetical protein T4D_4450 [Trichinella pseudospiralis]KRZ16973.1 hypothetical protein T4B_5218 [Trichinella pseudospiralis]KRZ44618.1 hypothetical protein T4C_11263 [Trichinella pseudospiralis]